LGVKYSLASKHTSFICVEKRDTPVIETMEQRNVPTNNNKVKKFVKKIVTLQRKSTGGGGGYSGGGGATATRSKTSLADISRGLVKKQKTKESYIDTPFGFKAEVAPKGLSDPYLEFVFMVRIYLKNNEN
jgi:hypothetical protein